MHPFDLADAVARLRDENGYTQKQIAQQTGKSEGEISKLLSLPTLAPDVQKIVREDQTDRITKRHLYALGRQKEASAANPVARSTHTLSTAP